MNETQFRSCNRNPARCAAGLEPWGGPPARAAASTTCNRAGREKLRQHCSQSLHTQTRTHTQVQPPNHLPEKNCCSSFRPPTNAYGMSLMCRSPSLYEIPPAYLPNLLLDIAAPSRSHSVQRSEAWWLARAPKEYCWQRQPVMPCCASHTTLRAAAAEICSAATRDTQVLLNQ